MPTNPTSAAAAKALHVGVIRAGKFVDDRWIEAGDVTVGEREGNTFVIPVSSLPRSVRLFERDGAATALLFDEAMQGRVCIAGRELDLAAARAQGLAKPAGAGGTHFELPLDEHARGRVTVGEVTFVFHFSPPPRFAPPPPLPPEARGTLWNVVDHTFTAVLAISLALHLGFVGAVSQRTLPPEDLTMADIPDRFARLLVPDKPAEEEKPKAEAKKDEKPDAKDEAKDEPDEKTADKDQPEEQDSVEHKKKVQEAVAKKGVVAIVGSLGQANDGSALANVFSAGRSISDDMGAALVGAKGMTVANDASAAARGEGAAQVTSIGDLATSGGGAKVAMREKRDVAVKGEVTADGEAEVDSPTVDKEAVAKFIRLRLRSVQACYEAQLKRSPTLRGKLVVRFVIGTRGQVVEVALDQDTMNNDAVASCVVRIVRAWKLPFTPDADTPVSFPFLFAPG